MNLRSMARSNTSLRWRFWTPCLALALVAGQITATGAEVTAPHENYRVLAWSDLVPAGWEAPVVSPAYNRVSEADIDWASVVSDLDGQLSALPGYLKPVVYEGNEVTEFLLVPFLPHQLSAHAHLEPNQMVYVRAIDPVIVEQPFEPIWIVGTLSLQPMMTEEGPAAYRMNDAVITRYEY